MNRWDEFYEQDFFAPLNCYKKARAQSQILDQPTSATSHVILDKSLCVSKPVFSFVNEANIFTSRIVLRNKHLLDVFNK